MGAWRRGWTRICDMGKETDMKKRIFAPVAAAVALVAGLTDREVALITEADEGYVLKFKAVELWQALKAELAG